MAERRAITDISVGTRHRKDMGDIKGLAASIADVGLLHPVVIKPSGRLVAGERRLKACAELGWGKVPVTVIDIGKIARGEYAENHFRKAFTPSEYADIADELEPVEREQAKDRERAGHNQHSEPSGKFPRGSTGRALDKVARAVGKDRKTVEKARAVRDAAKADPERFGKLQIDMDRTGRVDGPFKRLTVMTQAAAIRAEPPPLPSKGPYRVIIADPPWPYELRSEDPTHRATHPFPQMSIEAICAVDVGSLAHEHTVLGLWTTNHHMRQAYAVLDAWGFVEKTILTWVKDRFGTGDWLRGQTEHCIIAVRGKPVVELTNQSTVLYGPLRANSQKPDQFYEFIEKWAPAPRYAYLFSRDERANWDMHGDEVPQREAAQ